MNQFIKYFYVLHNVTLIEVAEKSDAFKFQEFVCLFDGFLAFSQKTILSRVFMLFPFLIASAIFFFLHSMQILSSFPLALK